MPPIITLTTDFGLFDEYVGVMKGVILSRCPSAAIVDISHNIPSQDVAAGAYLIRSAYRYFPQGTIHLLVVDPGVGTSRRLILVHTDNHYFLAPDNGLLTLVLQEAPCQVVYELSNTDLFLKSWCQTFHGRDILAPVAAHLASGITPPQVGRALESCDLILLDLPQPIMDIEKNQIRGEVVNVDHYGNLLTNISRRDFLFVRGQQPEANPVVSVGNLEIDNIRTSYAEVSPGELLALFSSRDDLEISVNRGSAADFLRAGRNTPVIVRFR